MSLVSGTWEMSEIFEITLYTKKKNPNNEKMKSLLAERFQCKIRFCYTDKIFEASAWCDGNAEEIEVQKRLTKYFNSIKE